MHPIGPRAIDESGLLTVAIPPTVVNRRRCSTIDARSGTIGQGLAIIALPSFIAPR